MPGESGTRLAPPALSIYPVASPPANAAGRVGVVAEPEYEILQAVVRAASAFLRSGDLSRSLCALLAGIGDATHASRAYVFRIDPPRPGGGLTATQFSEWTAHGVAPQFGTPEVRNMELEASGFDEWLDGFMRGTPFVSLVAELPDRPRERLSNAGIKSIAAVPIFAEQEFWGFLGVDDCETERRWSSVEVDALNTAAAVVGASILRQRMETALVDATMKAKLSADIGEVVTRAGDTVQQMLDRCSAAIMRHLSPDLVRIWMLSEDRACLVACTEAGAVSIQNAALDDLPLVSEELTRIACSKGTTEWRDGLPELWPGSTAELASLGLTGGVGLPLVTNGRINGVVVLLGREFPSPAVVDALESVTDEIALAIERHQAQGARSRAEARYRRLVDATVEGIVIHDGRQVLDANPSFAAMLGFAPEEVLGRNPFDFIAPEYHEYVRAQLMSNYQKPYEIEGVRRDGSRFPVELKGSDFTDEGRTLRVAAVRDITDRHTVQRTTEELREEQQARALAERTREQAEFLAEASRILAASLDTTTTMTQLAHLAVPRIADYCVVSLFDDSGTHRVAIVHADPLQEPIMRAAVASWPPRFAETHPIYHAISNNRSFIASDVTADMRAGLASSEGHHDYLKLLSPTSIMAVPISSGGVVLGSFLLGSVRKERRFGADDLALAEEFAHRAALALVAARSYHMAQEAVRARDELLAVVAHDLRNPLNNIFMGSELALEMIGDDVATPGVRQMQIIRRSAEVMNRLIEDLLDAKRIESGNLALETKEVSPAEVLKDACDLLSPLAAHQKITFFQRAEPGLPCVAADKARLLQVISNLVGNAIKFTPKGGAISVTAMCEDDPQSTGRFVKFSVKDTGTGIPADQLPHIFGRGWQARRGDRRGIGLGLSIASGIVEAHGGSIWVDSRVGEGSTFLFTVPVPAAAG